MENTLVGKVVIGLKLSQDEQYLEFQTTDGIIRWTTFANCCSYAWIAEIIGVNGFFGREVLSVEDVEGAESNRGKYGQLTQNYATEIRTDKTVVSIIFRNESNGYYGGSLEEMIEGKDGWWVFGYSNMMSIDLKEMDFKWKDITEDYPSNEV